MDAKADAVVFERGVHRHVRGGVEVTLVVPEDVMLSDLEGPIARLACAERGQGDGDRDAA